MAEFSHDAELRARIAANLAAAPRRRIAREALRAAAVSVVLSAREDGGSAFFLTLRQSRMSAHSGQYALPGGKLDPGETALEAARRELAEELSLSAGEEHLLGRLDDLPTRSGYAVTPFVFWLEGEVRPVPEPGEVAKLHHIPLGDLFAEDPGTDADDPRGEDAGRGVFWRYIPTLGHRVYAPTAAMLWQFREVGLTGRHSPAPHFAEPEFARR